MDPPHSKMDELEKQETTSGEVPEETTNVPDTTTTGDADKKPEKPTDSEDKIADAPADEEEMPVKSSDSEEKTMDAPTDEQEEMATSTTGRDSPYDEVEEDLAKASTDVAPAEEPKESSPEDEIDENAINSATANETAEEPKDSPEDKEDTPAKSTEENEAFEEPKAGPEDEDDKSTGKGPIDNVDEEKKSVEPSVQESDDQLVELANEEEPSVIERDDQLIELENEEEEEELAQPLVTPSTQEDKRFVIDVEDHQEEIVVPASSSDEEPHDLDDDIENLIKCTGKDADHEHSSVMSSTGSVSEHTHNSEEQRTLLANKAAETQKKSTLVRRGLIAAAILAIVIIVVGVVMAMSGSKSSSSETASSSTGPTGGYTVETSGGHKPVKDGQTGQAGNTNHHSPNAAPTTPPPTMAPTVGECDGVPHSWSPNDATTPEYAGLWAGNNICDGSFCDSPFRSKFDEFETYNGTTSQWFQAKAVMGFFPMCSKSIIPKLVKHRVSLEVPPGVNYAIHVYVGNSTNLYDSAAPEFTHHNTSFVEMEVSQSSDFEYWVHVEYLAGSSCEPWYLYLETLKSICINKNY